MNSKSQDVRDKEGTAVPLPIAASLAHFEVGHNAAIAQSAEQLDRLLNDAATALSAIADVYHEGDGDRARIPAQDVQLGRFKNGAQELISAEGRVYRSLSMRRVDVMQALVMLKKARGAQEPSE